MVWGVVTYLETSLSCIKVAGVSSLLTLPMFSYRSALLLFSLLAAPSAPCHSCVCQLCGGGLEVYRGTELLLTTSTTNVGLRNITLCRHQYIPRTVTWSKATRRKIQFTSAESEETSKFCEEYSIVLRSNNINISLCFKSVFWPNITVQTTDTPTRKSNCLPGVSQAADLQWFLKWNSCNQR